MCVLLTVMNLATLTERDSIPTCKARYLHRTGSWIDISR